MPRPYFTEEPTLSTVILDADWLDEPEDLEDLRQEEPDLFELLDEQLH